MASVARGAGEEEELGENTRAECSTSDTADARTRARSATCPRRRVGRLPHLLPRRILRLYSNRRPVRPCRQLARASTIRTPHRRRRLRFNAVADSSRWSPALRLIDDPVFQAAAEAPRSWNPPPPSLKSQPRKRKLTSDAEHTLFRPGYVPLDPEETSRGARDILAAVNAKGGAKTGEGSLGEERGADRKRGGSLVRRSPWTRSPVSRVDAREDVV